MRLHLNSRTLAPLALLLVLAACAHQHQTQPLPQGATSQADATAYRVLADAQAFLGSVRQSVEAGKLHMSVAQKLAFNSLVEAYNVAEAEWQTCHAGHCSEGDQQKMQADVGGLNAKLSAAQAELGAGGGR